MARAFDGSSTYLEQSGNYLSTSQAFTISGWWRPTAAASGPMPLIASYGGGSSWGIYHDIGSSEAISFFAVGYGGGDDPATNSATAALTAADFGKGIRFAYRYDGTIWEVWTGSPFTGLVKKTIDAGATFSLPSLSGGVTRIGADGSLVATGELAEIAIWTRALTDRDLELILRGTSPDSLSRRGLAAYWPLRGNGSPEPNYHDDAPAITVATGMTLNNAPASAAHPEVIGIDDQSEPFAAWVLDIDYPGGTVKAATSDLASPVDADVLGEVYPGRLVNGESIIVSKAIQDGIVAPGSTTVIVRNDTASPPTDIADLRIWLEADQIDADDGDTITAWPDLSKGGRSPAQYSSSGPTWRRAAVGGRPALQFDATTETLAIPAGFADFMGSGQTYTLIVVFGRVTTNAGPRIIMGGVGGSWYLVCESGNLEIRNGSTLSLGATPAVGVSAMVSYVHTGTTGRGYRDAGALVSGTSSQHPGSRLTIGADPGPTNHGDCYVAAVLGFARAISIDERRRVEHYLAAKYGVPGVDHGHLSPSTEWREAPARLRRYERSSHELVTELVGVVADTDFSVPGRAAITIVGASQAVLQERIPKRIVNTDEHPTATDLNVPIPVVFGRGWVSAPYIGRDETSSPGGADFAVSHVKDAAGAAMDVRVERVLMDIYGNPGLEDVSTWRAGGGGPTRDADNVLQLTGARDLFYLPGLPVRIGYAADGAGVYRYSKIASYSVGTNKVTLADSVLTSGHPDTVELVTGGYLIDSTTYESDGDPVLAVALQGTGYRGGIVVFARNHSITNPARVIEEILTNPAWGLGGTVDETLFDVAAADYTAASLGDACNYALGGDRQQRSARAYLSQILGLRGAWLDLQSDGSWGIYVDKPPVWGISRTFGMAGRHTNIERLTRHIRAPLQQAVKTLKLRYSQKGRLKTTDGVTSWLAPSDYEFQANVGVLPVGAELVEGNPWIRFSAAAGRVAYYRGKRMAAEDEHVEFIAGFGSRNVSLGEVVRLSLPRADVEGPYRVTGYSRGLRATQLTVAGYDPAIFTLDSGAVSHEGDGVRTLADQVDPDTGATPPAHGGNQVLNANFALTSGSFTPANSQANAAFLPGWIILEADGGAAAISALSVSDHRSWVGNRYLSITIANTADEPRLRTNSTLANSVLGGGIVVIPGEAYIFSAYVEKDGVGAADAAGWFPRLQYFDAANSQVGSDVDLPLVASGETTGPNAANRWFYGFRPPATATYVAIDIRFTATGTYRLGGIAVNRLSRFTIKPPPWGNTTVQS